MSMNEMNSLDKSHEFVKMEYQTLHEYYLWSLGTHSQRIDLFFKLLIGTLAASFTIILSSLPHKMEICGGVAASFMVIGILLLERVVTGQVTNTWCVYRINLLRKYIRENYNLEDVFRPVSVRSLREKPDLFGLMKYRLKSANLIISGNSFSAAGVVYFFGHGFVTLMQLIAASTLVCKRRLKSESVKKAVEK
jgi:hypothetical protein